MVWCVHKDKTINQRHTNMFNKHKKLRNTWYGAFTDAAPHTVAARAAFEGDLLLHARAVCCSLCEHLQPYASRPAAATQCRLKSSSGRACACRLSMCAVDTPERPAPGVRVHRLQPGEAGQAGRGVAPSSSQHFLSLVRRGAAVSFSLPAHSILPELRRPLCLHSLMLVIGRGIQCLLQRHMLHGALPLRIIRKGVSGTLPRCFGAAGLPDCILHPAK